MNRQLIKINLVISLILLTGFGLVAWLGNRINYGNSIRSLEQVAALAADSISYQLSQILNKPIDVVLTMSHDTFLKNHLARWYSHTDEQEYTDALQKYLSAYHREYKFDSVFLVCTASGRYYSFNGFDRIISRDNADDVWYYNFLNSGKQYELNIDANKEQSANRAITVFINSRVQDATGQTIGVIGIGIRVDYLKKVIQEYEETYDVEVFFVNREGKIEVSGSNSEIQGQNLFALPGTGRDAKAILDRENDEASHGFWADSGDGEAKSLYLVTRYLPALSWYVVIGHNTARIVQDIKLNLLGTLAVLVLIIGAVVILIAKLTKKFNTSFARIIDQRHDLFKKATKTLYEDILEWNIEKNTFVDKNTGEYLKKLGANNPTYDECIRLIAEKQVAPEFREDYCRIFARENIMRTYAQGINHVQYDLKLTRDGVKYHWLRIYGHIFYSPEEDALHMFSYRRNVDEEKHKEQLANIDEMTGCYTKKATERMIGEELENRPDSLMAFFILDIDNFKQVNDRYGHACGDLCIRQFAKTIKSHFREHDIVGRLGGDEFGVFLTIPSREWLLERGAELSRALNFTCSDGNRSWVVSASIGVSIYPNNGASFAALYKCADQALYRTKQNGKNGISYAEGAES